MQVSAPYKACAFLFKPLSSLAKVTLSFLIEFLLILSQQVSTVIDNNRCLEQL